MTPEAPLFADSIAAIVGLLAAQVFLVGFLLVRLDSLGDRILDQMEAAADRLKTGSRVDLPDAVRLASDTRLAVDDELRRSRARVIIGCVPILALLLWYVTFSTSTGDAWPWQWWGLLTPVPRDWDLDRTAVAGLVLVILALLALAYYRSVQVRRMLGRRRPESLTAVLHAYSAIIGDAADSRSVDSRSVRRPGAKRIADDARDALRGLAQALPNWEWTRALTSDFWLAVFNNVQLQTVLNVGEAKALERAWQHLELAKEADERGAISLRAAELALQRSQVDGEDTAHWLRQARRLVARVSAPELAYRAEVLGIEILRAQLADLRESGAFAQSPRVRRVMRSIEAGLDRGRGMLAPDDEMLLARIDWVMSEGRRSDAEEAIRELGEALLAITARLRAARSDEKVLEIAAELEDHQDVLEYVRVMVSVREWDKPAGTQSGLQLDTLLGADLSPALEAFRTEEPDKRRRLLAELDRENDGYTLTAAWHAYRLSQSGGNRGVLRARLSLLLHPVRRFPQPVRTAGGFVALLALIIWQRTVDTTWKYADRANDWLLRLVQRCWRAGRRCKAAVRWLWRHRWLGQEHSSHTE